MGGATETLLVALGSGGTATALISAVGGWLTARRTKVSVEVTDGDRSQRVEIDSANAAAAAKLLREVFEATSDPS